MSFEQGPPNSRARNFAYALLAGQAGCWTLVIIIVALLAGLWLDAQTGQRGVFTIGLLLMSIPISLFAMVRIALASVKRIPPPTPRSTQRRNSQDT